jgi:L-threonylcarbamoyladenylate synthase
MALIGKDIKRAKQLLEAGEVVAIPTETVYGLAGNALNTDAVARIFEVKDRPFFDPLIVHVATLASAIDLVTEMPPQAQQLVDRFWPGPLTLLLNKSEIIPDLVTAGLDRVGVRCPDHDLTRSLLEQLPFPLAAPSANPFGYVSPTTAAHVQEQLGNKIPYILDGGPCQVGIESTIVGWENDQPVVYRLGGVSIEQIQLIIGSVKVLAHSTSTPEAPGQLKSHYAPQKRFYLGEIELLLKEHPSRRVGTLTFRKKFITGVDDDTQLTLSSTGDMHEAARNLFSMLRRFDKMDIEVVLAEEVPNEGLGRAINDRLRRAAAR